MANDYQGSITRDILFGTPRTRLGRWSTALACAFVFLFLGWLIYVLVWDFRRPTFFSDPLHAVLILSAAAAAVAGAVVGLLAVLLRRERSLRVVLSILWGIFVLMWGIAEVVNPH